MTLTLLPKPTLDDFITTCTPLAIIPALEEEMRERIDQIADALISYADDNSDPVEQLATFLSADPNFLGIILALTNLSQEKFKRILSAERFTKGDFGAEWEVSKIYREMNEDAEFAHNIARLFLEGRDNELLLKQVASFYLDQLSLPANWREIIRDPQLIQNAIRRKLTGEYTVKKGVAMENVIRERLDMIQNRYGVEHTKGQVHLVRKEVDHAIPSLADPYVMIMTSYMETTSSSQTTRANEQREMYLDVQRENQRYGQQRAFVNFVDGAGWLARRADLRKLYDGCDYIVNLNTLDRLEAIVCRYMPDNYFTKNPRPEVVEG